MKSKVLLLLIFTISIAGSGFSQKFIYFPTWNVDSLLAMLPAQTGTERIKTLNRLATSLSYIDYDSSLVYAGEALELSKEIGYKEGMGKAFTNFGYISAFRGNYPEALKNYFNALQVFENAGMKGETAHIYSSIATVHYYAKNRDKAIENCKVALRIYREQNNEGIRPGSVKDSIIVYAQMSLYYYLSDSCRKAVDYTLKYLDVGRRNNFGRTDLFFYLILAGERYSCLGQTDSARLFLNKALAYPDENRDIVSLKYRAVHAMGILNYSLGKTDSAIICFKKALKFYNEKGFLFWSSSLAQTLGYIYYKRNQIDIAVNYLHLAESFFNEILEKKSWYRHDSLKHIASWGMELYIPVSPVAVKVLAWNSAVSTFYLLYQIKKAGGETNEALNYYIAYSNAGDTLEKIRHSQELIQLQTSFETERYEEKINTLSQANEIHQLKLEQSRYFLFGLGTLLVIIVLVAVFILRLNKLQDQQQNLLLQQKLFRSQMNPHFIFNSLTSIQNYILDAEAHKASKYLSRFSKLIRNILDSSIEEFVPLEEEISTIENYLELQKIRFKNKFDYSIEIDKAINPENVNIPPMLAQPFIENSIEHGIKHKKSKGNIHIRFILLNNRIVLEVEDDGVGRKKAQEILFQQDKDHKSLGTAITHERIRVMNKKLKKKITLRILDLKNADDDPKGTKIVINLPFH